MTVKEVLKIISTLIEGTVSLFEQEETGDISTAIIRYCADGKKHAVFRTPGLIIYILCLLYKKCKVSRKTHGSQEGKRAMTYTSLEQLPVALSAEDVAQVLGISRANAYILMHSKGFPTIRIGKRMSVPKDKLIEWMNKQISAR